MLDDSFWNNYLVFTASKGDHPPVSSAGTEVPHGQVGVLTLFSLGGLEKKGQERIKDKKRVLEENNV